MMDYWHSWAGTNPLKRKVKDYAFQLTNQNSNKHTHVTVYPLGLMSDEEYDILKDLVEEEDDGMVDDG